MDSAELSTAVGCLLIIISASLSSASVSLTTLKQQKETSLHRDL
jgi:hypothetical protein